jgi:hypothetical protein
MKPTSILLGLLLLLSSLATAQVAVPTTPTSFTKRGLSGGISSSDASVNVSSTKPKPTAPSVITITYLSLSPPRQFTSSQGKSLLGKLIAWEDFQVSGQSSAAPQLTAPPTVIREGKARLLVNQKPYEIALEKLSAADQDFIQKTAAAASKAPAK